MDVYGTQITIVTGAFVNQLTSLGGPTLKDQQDISTSRAFPGWGNFESSWTWLGGPETKVHLVAFDNDSPNTKPDAPCMKYVYVYHQNHSNVRKYTMHGAYGKGFWYFGNGSHGSDPFSDGSCDVISPQPKSRSSCELFFVVFSRLGGPLRHHELHAELAEPKAKASGNRVRMGWIPSGKLT